MILKFQNTNPERGRKLDDGLRYSPAGGISEHEPRKGTETPALLADATLTASISECEPRKGTETGGGSKLRRKSLVISEREPRKGTEQAMISY